MPTLPLTHTVHIQKIIMHNKISRKTAGPCSFLSFFKMIFWHPRKPVSLASLCASDYHCNDFGRVFQHPLSLVVSTLSLHLSRVQLFLCSLPISFLVTSRFTKIVLKRRFELLQQRVLITLLIMFVLPRNSKIFAPKNLLELELYFLNFF